jgi:hypothetical protein
LLCRPKPETVGVMFLQDDEFWWTHLTVWEFAGLYELWIDITWGVIICDGKVDVSCVPSIAL